MELLTAGLSPAILAFVIGITVASGFVKGSVGFAMPMIMISGFATFLPPELALAALIVPTVVSNVWQALRDGLRAAVQTARRFRLYLVVVVVCIALSAQLVGVLPDALMFLILGLPVTAFALAQLLGWRLRLRPEHRGRAEVGIGAFAGFVGGLSGVWGPPTVAYLTAIETPKSDQMRIQGVIYGIGGVALLAAHVGSGVVNAQTAPFSTALLFPALFGMWIGFKVSDRLDQERFRKATLAVLVIAGLNLVRRGIMG